MFDNCLHSYKSHLIIQYIHIQYIRLYNQIHSYISIRIYFWTIKFTSTMVICVNVCVLELIVTCLFSIRYCCISNFTIWVVYRVHCLVSVNNIIYVFLWWIITIIIHSVVWFYGCLQWIYCSRKKRMFIYVLSKLFLFILLASLFRLVY